MSVTSRLVSSWSVTLLDDKVIFTASDKSGTITRMWRYRPTKNKKTATKSRSRLIASIFRSLVIVAIIVSLFALPVTVVAFKWMPTPANAGGYKTFETPIANPALASRACLGGLQIALVADVSGSITRVPQSVTKMKGALRDFVSALLTGAVAPIKFSLTKFSDSAEVVQGMTNNTAALFKAIDNLNGAGATNWEAGIRLGAGTFPARTSDDIAKRLIIVVTDGDPTMPNSGLRVEQGENVPGVFYNGEGGDISTAYAILAANAAKRQDIRIVGLAIEGEGGKPTLGTIKRISGSNVDTGDISTDIITANFDSVSSKLVNFATGTCKPPPPPAPTPGPGPGTGGTGPGTGNTGTGTGDKGTGTGNTGTGTGTKGDGTGETGTGTGTKGDGKGETGTGEGKEGDGDGETGEGEGTGETGDGVGTTAGGGEGTTGTGSGETGGVTPEPTPAPAPAANVIEDEPEPAPVPEAQGTETIPPKVKPSIFFDGIEYTKGSLEDNVVLASVARVAPGWWYVVGGSTVTILLVSGSYYYLWKRKHPGKVMNVWMRWKGLWKKR